MDLLTEVAGIIVGAISSVVTAIGSGVNSALTAVFLDAEGGLSVFAQFGLIFGGIALALSLVYLVFNIVRGKTGA